MLLNGKIVCDVIYLYRTILNVGKFITECVGMYLRLMHNFDFFSKLHLVNKN